MKHSPIDAAKSVPCTACRVDRGEECWPRAEGDSNWVHTERRALLESLQAELAQGHGLPEFVLV